MDPGDRDVRKMLPEEIDRIKKMKWQDIDDELEEAYEEYARENPEQSGNPQVNQDKIMYDEWSQYFKDIASNDTKPFHQILEEEEDPEEAKDESVKTGGVKDDHKKRIHVDEIKIGLPESLDVLNKDALKDIFYYIPNDIRVYIVHHDFMMEMLSHYMSEYITQPSKNKFEPIGLVIENAKKVGLAYRKMYCVKGKYAVLFLSFSDRIDETMVEDFMLNAEMMMYDEAMEIEKRIEEQEKRDMATDPNIDLLDGSIVRLDGRGEDNEKSSFITIKGHDTILSISETQDYIYSNVNVMIYYELDIETVPQVIKDNTVIVIHHEKYSKMMCKFHCLNVLTM